MASLAWRETTLFLRILIIIELLRLLLTSFTHCACAILLDPSIVSISLPNSPIFLWIIRLGRWLGILLYFSERSQLLYRTKDCSSLRLRLCFIDFELYFATLLLCFSAIIRLTFVNSPFECSFARSLVSWLISNYLISNWLQLLF